MTRPLATLMEKRAMFLITILQMRRLTPGQVLGYPLPGAAENKSRVQNLGICPRHPSLQEQKRGNDNDKLRHLRQNQVSKPLQVNPKQIPQSQVAILRITIELKPRLDPLSAIPLRTNSEKESWRTSLLKWRNCCPTFVPKRRRTIT